MFSWFEREKLIPNYKINGDNEKKVKDDFLRIKNIASLKYNLQGLSDLETEEALFHMYILQMENFTDDLDKILLLDYIENFMKQVYQDLSVIVTFSSDSSTLKNNQELFENYSNVINKNKAVTRDCLHKYFCRLNEYGIRNKLNDKVINMKDDFLPKTFNIGNNFFDKENNRDPEIEAKHSLKEFNYDKNYWFGYVNELLDMKDDLYKYFEENDKAELLNDFRQCAEIYHLYSIYYKIFYNLEKNKERTR